MASICFFLDCFRNRPATTSLPMSGFVVPRREDSGDRLILRERKDQETLHCHGTSPPSRLFFSFVSRGDLRSWEQKVRTYHHREESSTLRDDTLTIPRDVQSRCPGQDAIFFFFLYLCVRCVVTSRRIRKCSRSHTKRTTLQRLRWNRRKKKNSLVVTVERLLYYHYCRRCYYTTTTTTTTAVTVPPSVETFARTNITPLPLSLHYLRCYD